MFIVLFSMGNPWGWSVGDTKMMKFLFSFWWKHSILLFEFLETSIIQEKYHYLESYFWKMRSFFFVFVETLLFLFLMLTRMIQVSCSSDHIEDFETLKIWENCHWLESFLLKMMIFLFLIKILYFLLNADLNGTSLMFSWSISRFSKTSKVQENCPRK